MTTFIGCWNSWVWKNNIMRGCWFTLLLCWLLIAVPAVLAQSPSIPAADSLSGGQDTAQIRKKVRKTWPHPPTASYLSLALPGLGQAYNKDYWKIPLVYGAIGGALYAGLFYDRQYDDWQVIYQGKLRAESDSVFAIQWALQDPYPTLGKEQIQSQRDQVRRARDFWYLMTGVAYALNAVEAYVAAHLKFFDVSDDLSIRVEPSLQPFPTSSGLGLSPTLGLTLRIE